MHFASGSFFVAEGLTLLAFAEGPGNGVRAREPQDNVLLIGADRE